MILDVGCGACPKGDVNIDVFKCGYNVQTGNQQQGEYMDARQIPNFVLADAEHLPFKDEVFDVAYSSHVIEHVANPYRMFREMVRVSKRKVVIRCPHRRGGGAKRPFHRHYFDEEWFRNVAEKMGLASNQFVVSFDFPITERLPIHNFMKRSIFYRAVRHVERSLQRRGYIKTPFEVECWVQKHLRYVNEKVVFVISVDNPQE